MRLAVEIEDRRGEAIARLFLGILLWEASLPEAAAMLAKAGELAVEMGLNRVEAVSRSIHARMHREAGRIPEALELSDRAMELLEKFGAELSDRIVITATHALVLRTDGEEKEATDLESRLRDRLRKETARIRSPLLRMRHQRASERLLAAALSPEGPVYPRVRESGP